MPTDEERRRELLGEIIEREIQARWRTKILAERDIDISHATLHRLTTGDKVGAAVLAKVEHALQLPRGLFRHFIVGDADDIATMPFDEASAGWDADLQRVMLKALSVHQPINNETVSRQTAN